MLPSGVERARSCIQLLFVFTTQRLSLLREFIGEITRELFQLRGEPARQLEAQRIRCGGMRLARLLVGFLLKSFERACSFIGYFRAPRSKLLFPLLEGEAPFGGDGV